jgi:hypothetical protein
MDVQVEMQDFGAERFAMLEEVRGYWAALCAEGLPPRRSQIDPRGIAGTLEYAFVAERNAAGQVKIRIAGMGLTEIAGLDLTGVSLTTLFDTASRDSVGGTLARMLDEPAMVEMWLEALRGPGRPPLEARLLLLPLRAEDGSVRMILGCLAAVGEVGNPPRRFAVTRRVARTMGATAAQPAAQPAFAERQEPFAGPLPYLRVVKRAS